MAQDISRYVRWCSVCAITYTPSNLPKGKLVPLPIPRHPWSHLGIDFMTDLPPSNHHICVFVVVDHFSKACKLIPIKGLPTAFEATELLFQQVFRHYGLQEDIVSDRGPQLISQVWKAFFKLLYVSVNLSSDYHPQTNSQTERKIQETGRYLRSYCHQHQDTWSCCLPILRNRCPNPPLGLLRSNVSLATKLLSSPGPENPWRFQLSITCSKRARGYGTQRTCISSRQCEDTNSKRMSVELKPPNTSRDKGFGFPPATFVFACPAVIGVPAI
jgi:hypothetical protein